MARRDSGDGAALAALVIGGVAAWFLGKHLGRKGGSGVGLGSGSGAGAGVPAPTPAIPTALTPSVSPASPMPPTPPVRSILRLSSSGLQLNGETMTLDQVVAVCRGRGTVELIVTGDARAGDRSSLIETLRAAGIDVVFLHKAGAP